MTTRSKGYENEIIKEGDIVFYQNQDKKAWLGPMEVFSVQKNAVFLFANGSMKKVPRCNVQLCNYEGESVEQQSTEMDESGESPKAAGQTVNFKEENFWENLNEEENGEIGRRRTRSMTAVERRELERDKT